MGFSSALELYGYQQAWLKDFSRFKIGMFARQTGKTFCSTLELVNDCLDAETQGGRRRWVILSRGERQAKEAMDEGVKRHLNAYQAGFESLDYQWEGSYKALEVALPNGSRITALPANPDTARGFSASVFLDEFAFHKDSREIWKALFPVISKPGLKLRVVSTPNGKDNKFYELMTSDDGAWSRHQCDIYRAVAEGLPRDVDELRNALNDPDAWAQEFELQWLDEASAWLSYDLIASCEHEHAGDPQRYSHGLCYVGMDIGRRRDLTVIWVVEDVQGVLWTREVVSLRRASFAEQQAELHRIMTQYRVGRVCMDQTGMGEVLVEQAKRQYGEYQVEGLLFSGAVKQDLATVLKAKFEDRRLQLPISTQIRQAHHAIKKVVTVAGNPRFDAERSEAGHADEFWAHALAVHGATHPATAIEFTPLGQLRENFAGYDQAQKETPIRVDRGFGVVGGGDDLRGW